LSRAGRTVSQKTLFIRSTFSIRSQTSKRWDHPNGLVSAPERAEDHDFDADEDDEQFKVDIAAEQADEEMTPVREGSLRLKVRQHVNPLASTYQIPQDYPTDWVAKAFDNPKLPIIVDIGCAKGSWALKLASKYKNINVLGLEIRRPVVDLCLRRKDRWGLRNVHFLSCNANVDLDRILTDLKAEGADLNTVTIQFPDPHFKSKHKKRRVVNEKLVNTICSHIDMGKHVFLQSDILDVTEDMVTNFSHNPSLSMVEGYDPKDLTKNASPFDVLTEREIATQAKGLPVYRMYFKKTSEHTSTPNP
jgi:tRNA (guanine-N7-)-methyltransferase